MRTILYNDRPMPPEPPAEPEVVGDLGASLRWFIARHERELAWHRRRLERVQADAKMPPESRVQKLGKGWAIRSIGSDTKFPGIFPTRKKAIEMAVRNAETVLDMVPHTIEEIEDLLTQERERLAQHETETLGRV